MLKISKAKIFAITLACHFYYPLSVEAKIPESRMVKYEEEVSLTKKQEESFYQLANKIYSATASRLYSYEGWGRYGIFYDKGMEVQGSLAYGMALNESSDLDVAFVYNYEGGESMRSFDPVYFKSMAIDVFKSVFGNEYSYTMKDPVVNLKNSKEDVDVAFFNLLKRSTSTCNTVNRCSELNYGKNFDGAEWYETERLSLYSTFDDVFTIGTEKRKVINRTGKFFKLWRSNVFVDEVVKVPSIALITMMHDFSKDKGDSYKYTASTETLRDVIRYSIDRYFGGTSCRYAFNAEVNLPVYQRDRNLLGKLSSEQRINLCKELVEFNDALIYATSESTSESESVKALEPFIGEF